MATAPADISELKQQFAKENLERLSHYEPPSKPTPPESDLDFDCGIALAILEKWSTDNKESMQNAMEARVYHEKQDIDWKVAFLPFMESMGVYLRDWGKYQKSWITYREFKNGNGTDIAKFDLALSLYEEAFTDIDKLADKWDMDFVVLSDLIDKHPDGHVDWDGPFCGAFITRSAQKERPFMGLAFKGTNPLNLLEVKVDESYDLQPAEKYLENKRVSIGVYTGLFGDFEPPWNPPYTHIKSRLNELAKALPNTVGGAIPTHVTGHSLGGSYSQFCYSQLLIDVAPETPSNIFFFMGDEYTFGAPRVGCEEWSEMTLNLVGWQRGRSWRIVNDKDIVPQVPPTMIKPAQLDFYHIDDGMRIFKDKNPEPIPTERHLPPAPPYDIKTMKDLIDTVIKIRYHMPNDYYTAMVRAIKG
ncbi:lipase [Patellaria atrata CBS 101060]|uniref:Lipase n=1 Tax=Patellaria atrata CBS 101060 TaxID=1346257 RepID=A0A9P4VQE6_9PEZI|nr:lipase [Patellaria atrata CBS 101060]